MESDKEAFTASIVAWRKTRFLAARHARFSYQRALHLSPWQANIYADIAITSNLMTSLNKNDNQELNDAWYDPCNLIIFNDIIDYYAPLKYVVLAGS